MERILDVLIGASASTRQNPADGARQLNFIEEMVGAFGAERPELDHLLSGFADETIAHIAETVRAKLGRPPGPSWASLLSVAGLFVHRHGRPGLLRGLVGLGGHILIGGVAYKASLKSGHAQNSSFSPMNATANQSRLLARVIIASVASAAYINADDPPWVLERFEQAGLTSDDIAWLAMEFAKPASRAALTTSVDSFEGTMLVYAAACIAVDRRYTGAGAFLDNLSDDLKLAMPLCNILEKEAHSLKTGTANS